MPVSLSETRYKDIPAITLESDDLAVQVLPGHGAKIASLVYKKTGREFLVQEKGTAYKTFSYDGSYVEAECSGFDDMFPTIDRMFYTDYPWKGLEAPDHGEVCSLAWDWEIRDDALDLQVHGVRFPYLLQKSLRFGRQGQLLIQYKATGLSGFDLDFLWAAHMMINSEDGGEIILPFPDNAPATCIFSNDRDFGSRGSRISWPETPRLDGGTQVLNITGPRNEQGNSYKVYFDQKIPAGWCAYHYKSDGTRLTLSFPADRVPYLGLWVNEGSFHGHQNIALEACTGAYDRPDLARLYGQGSVLPAHGTYEWYFHILAEG